jgi:hypothetical protein
VFPIEHGDNGLSLSAFFTRKKYFVTQTRTYFGKKKNKKNTKKHLLVNQRVQNPKKFKKRKIHDLFEHKHPP